MSGRCPGPGGQVSAGQVSGAWWSGYRWSGGQMVRCSGGQEIRWQPESWKPRWAGVAQGNRRNFLSGLSEPPPQKWRQSQSRKIMFGPICVDHSSTLYNSRVEERSAGLQGSVGQCRAVQVNCWKSSEKLIASSSSRSLSSSPAAAAQGSRPGAQELQLHIQI